MAQTLFQEQYFFLKKMESLWLRVCNSEPFIRLLCKKLSPKAVAQTMGLCKACLHTRFWWLQNVFVLNVSLYDDLHTLLGKKCKRIRFHRHIRRFDKQLHTGKSRNFYKIYNY